MTEHTRYGTGTDDLKKDLQKKITDLKSQAWDLEHEQKYYTLLSLYRDLIAIQQAMIAILSAESDELTWFINANDEKKDIP